MKKIIIFIMFLFIFQMTAANAAAVKGNKDITLDFTLNYKSQVPGSTGEHVMKNVLRIAGDKWHVAGRFQTNKNDKLLLFLVKLVSHRNSKFTFQFMMIDADNKNVFITEPKFTLMAGLPAEHVTQGNGRIITLKTLLNLTATKGM